jgi:hypothetical protein
MIANLPRWNGASDAPEPIARFLAFSGIGDRIILLIVEFTASIAVVQARLDGH